AGSIPGRSGAGRSSGMETKRARTCTPSRSRNRNWQGTSDMHYRLFGRSEAIVSEIGFGTWGIGGTRNGAVAYGPTDDRDSVAALRRAFERGVTFYDTADLYGHGHSEHLLAQALGDVRGQIFLATKAGFLDAEGHQDFSTAHLERALAQSI